MYRNGIALDGDGNFYKAAFCQTVITLILLCIEQTVARATLFSPILDAFPHRIV